ncbi:Glycosyltransferase involved in cell wall bisynthesis [Actinokineospora alba]|uniref:Glycosyltransferase involved in cell wall bisynthesis n=1 Tax=Actinokineospora alba TaxID=504798 RepID=A0A1H0PGZ0_9PSEU|nr:glycosyltransferase family 4 protein [Actinokineospora alba]TDP65779.1 glycosyltransferase involved in cell wall biosynthesis [Actinokineospora alba]SDI65307.1 Glycosyltransferase involved in cell wall bisynthesis [Actinokineospora alba]SDP03876.1 Glycosyltransferase involved in cell wall bisynthesis [Actinokineospora alba]
MRLGFACSWDPVPELTWSHTPWNLRAALRNRVDVVDLGVEHPAAVRTAFKAAYARRVDGRWVSMWRHSKVARRYEETLLRKASRTSDCDAVLQIQDLAVLDKPYFLLQDLSYDVLTELIDQPGGLSHFPSLTREAVRWSAERQHRVYASAAGVLAMSGWFADHLVRVSGLPPEKVHVVNPGVSTGAPDPAATRAAHARRMSGPRRRLLLVGKDFHTKAGDQVVAALEVLRRDVDPELTLTVVGPREWPLPGPVPPGVEFLGRRPVGELAALYDAHDLFVLPSRFEGFGIAFVEALSRGLPCVGRDAFAMPEIIQAGRTGDLVRGDDPADLAKVIAEVLADDDIYRHTHADAPRVAEHYTWDRAARQVAEIAAGSIG